MRWRWNAFLVVPLLFNLCAAARFLAAKPAIDDVEAFRLNVREAERNVSKIETDVAAVVANYTNLISDADAGNTTVTTNYDNVDKLSLHVAESQAGIDLDINSEKKTEEIAAEVLKTSAALKEKAAGGASPQNITRMETLEKKLWEATDAEKPESIDKFKEELRKTEAALAKFEADIHAQVKSLIYGNRTLERQVGKMAKELKKLHSIHLSVT